MKALVVSLFSKMLLVGLGYCSRINSVSN